MTRPAGCRSALTHVCRLAWSSLNTLSASGLIVILAANAAHSQQATPASALRGSTNAYSGAATTSLRGSSSHDAQINAATAPEPEVLVYEEVAPSAHDDPYNSGPVSEDVGLALGTLRRDFIPTIFFNGPGRAVADRKARYPIPDRPSLRHSLLHSANVYEGLRGSEAGVGDTVALALRGSYSTRAQIERAEADRARVDGALANFLPKLTGTVTAGFASGATSGDFSYDLGQVGLGFELSMPIYSSGVNLNTYKQAKHLSLASDLNLLAEEYRVSLEAIASHINLRLNRRIENTLQSNVSAMKRIAHIAERLYEAGDASRTDIAIAQANVESARSEVDLAQKTREETLTDYESLTDTQAPGKLLAPAYAKFVPEDVDVAVAMAINNNPALVSSLHTAIASGFAAKAERGRFGPKVDLYSSYNEPVYQATNSDTFANWNFGVRLRVPLLDATFVPSVNEARHEALEAQFRALDQSRIVERQVRRQWSAYKSAQRRVGIVARQVRAVAASVEGARREYEAGFRSISDVLNNQVKLARARITLETAKHEQMLAAYELAFTTGHPRIRHLAKGKGYN